MVLFGFVVGWVDGSLGYDQIIAVGLAVEVGAVGLLATSGRI